ncbi:MAG: hypothetical protein LBS90_04510 [Oscillospiraceae bacterium]|jgi:hypothetical protein|nr:hypothetical protein [Oscillospiraceae bacterium]
MSVKGIDNQIMVTRTSDYARELSAQQHRGDAMQDYLAVQAQAREKYNMQSVRESNKSEKEELKTGKDGGGNGARQRGGGSPEDREPADENDDFLIPDAERSSIDVIV